MTDRIPELVKHQFFVMDQQIKQLRHEQLSPHMRVWVISMEALFIGLGIGLCFVAGSAFFLDGVDAAIAAAQNLIDVAVGAALLVTLLLRGAWVASIPVREVIAPSPEDLDVSVEQTGDDTPEADESGRE